MKKSWPLYFTAGLFAFVFLLRLFLDPSHLPNFSDFNVYYAAGSKALSHRTVYDVQGHYQYKYAPLVSLAFGALLTLLPAEGMQWVFYGVFLLGWLLFAGVIARRWGSLARQSPGGGRAAFLLAWVFVLLYAMGLRDEMKLGQVNLIPFTLLYLFFRGLEAPHRRLGSQLLLALALSLAIQFKLYCAIVYPLLVFRKEFRIILLSAASVLLSNGVALGLYDGWSFARSELMAWIASLFQSSADLLTSVYNVSAWGMLARALGPAPSFWIWLALVLAFVALQFRVRMRRAQLQFAWICTLIPILNPLAWPYWMLLSFPAAFWIASRWRILAKREGQVFWVFCAALLVLNNLQNQDGGRYGGTFLANALICCAFFRWAIAGRPFDSRAARR